MGQTEFVPAQVFEGHRVERRFATKSPQGLPLIVELKEPSCFRRDFRLSTVAEATRFTLLAEMEVGFNHDCAMDPSSRLPRDG